MSETPPVANSAAITTVAVQYAIARSRGRTG
jgi:hypothetical protein